MGQKYKIFINEKVLFLAQNPAEVSEILISSNQYIIQPFKDKKNLKRLFIILLGDVNKSNMVIYHSDLDKVLKAIISEFEYLEAAGGVVRNDHDQILLIHRRGFWDLPKGKQEKKEKIEQTAIREVCEETGVQKVKIIDQVTYPEFSNKCTYHSYVLEGQNILKASYWYNMETDHSLRLVPQKDEDIEQAIWVNERDLEDYYPNMYPSIVDVLKASIALKKIEGSQQD